MSYVIDQEAAPEGSRRRRWPWVLLAVIVLAGVATGAFLLGRGGTGSGDATKPSSPIAPPPVETGPLGPLEWKNLAGTGTLLPRSAKYGPREEIGGVARGYSHDEAGAALAAINIANRASSAAGPGTYQAVLQAQAYGNVELAMQELASQSSSSSPEETKPQQWWYAIKAGDPRGDLVEVSLLARTAQADQMGGYAKIDRTLAWRDGDWKMLVPVTPLSLATSTAGYTPMGGPR